MVRRIQAGRFRRPLHVRALLQVGRCLIASQLLCRTAVAAPTNSSNTSAVSEFNIGVLGPITSLFQGFIGVVAAFDLDFRKNWDPLVRARLGPPVVQIPDLHPDLRIRPIIGTSDATASVAIDTVLGWLDESGTSPMLSGLVGEFYSSISAPVASIAGAKGLPQVSWASTNPALSNKGTYPFFSRTISSDSVQGSAMWAWTQHYGIPAVAFVYTAEAYGEGLFQVMLNTASSAGRADRVHGIPLVPFDEDLQSSYEATRLIRATGTRFVMLACADTGNFVMYAMEQEGILYQSHQILASEAVGIWPHLEPQVSRGYPAGFQRFQPQSIGRLYGSFASLWTNLTLDDVFSIEASERYMLEQFLVPLSDATAPPLTQADFNDASTLDNGGLNSFLFDAMYAYAFGLNALLNNGVENVTGDKLLEAVRNASFEGVTGDVAFDVNGDRLAPLNLECAVVEASTNTTYLSWIGTYMTDGELVLHELATWAPRAERGVLPPEELFNCDFGFEKDTTTNLCVPCSAGIGCGYREEDGIPIGIAFPMTSIIQDFLGVVATFYKDLQRNLDPSLGEPIVKLRNVSSRLKLRLQVGTSHSTVSIGMNTALDWFLGSGDFSRVAGIAFGFHSNIAIPVASIAAGFETPMVGFGATNPTLSDKVQYPYFLRTVAPDSLQGSAMWSWKEWFLVPTVAYVYTLDAYGSGLFSAFSQAASDARKPSSSRGYSVRLFEGEPDLAEYRDACSWVRQLGTRFIMIAMIFSQATPLLYVMEQELMLYGSQAYQIFATESVFIDEQSRYIPSLGLPLGFQKYIPTVEGPLFPQWARLWRNLTLEDVYGVPARQRYMLDYLRVPLSDAASPPLTQESFLNPPPSPFLMPLLFDALYTYAVAINNLLLLGMDAKDIHGPILLEALRNASFEGVSGQVSFNKDGDRYATYGLYNIKAGGSGFTFVGNYDANSGTFSSLDSQGEPLALVWVDGEIDTQAPAKLKACLPGQSWDDRDELCSKCAAGFVSDGGLGAECRPCPPGATSSDDATECLLCREGYYRDISEDNCTDCPAGSFAASNGSSACDPCEIGMYMPTVGASACKLCGAGRASVEFFTTLERLLVNGAVQYNYVLGSDTVEHCGCDKGRWQDAAGECVACTEGMECPGFDSIFIAPGYYSEAWPDISIYQCHGDPERCAGGVPGATCAEGRRGLTCSECEDDMTPADGGGCKPCGDTDNTPFFIVLFLLMAMVVGVYFATTSRHSRSQSLSLVLCAIAAGQLVTALQQMGVVAALSLQWKEPFKSLVGLISILAFDVEVLRLNCVSTIDPRDKYIMKLCMLLAGLVWLCVVHVLSVCVFGQRKFQKRRWSLYAALAAILLIFYIALTSIVLEPWQCMEHPNGKWTVLNYYSIVCWESSEHVTMLVLGSIAFFAVPVTFLVTLTHIAQQFPARLQRADEKYVKAFAFLFFRFKPGKQWFLVAHTAKGLTLAMCLAIPETTLETLSMQAILLVAFGLTLRYQPWRVDSANILDAVLSACILFVVIVASFFIPDEGKDLSALSWLSFILLVSGLLLIPVVIASGLWRKYFRPLKPYAFFLCHHKAAAGSYTRLLKMYLRELPKLDGDIFIDADNLNNLDHLFDYVRSDTRKLVIVATADIFTRPWCVGEMTTARLHKVTTVLLAMPSCKLPDEHYIMALERHGFTGIEVLLENKMDLQMIEETILWASSVPSIKAPKEISRHRMHTLAVKIQTPKVKDQKADQIGAETELYQSMGQMGAETELYQSFGATTTSGVVETKQCYIMYDTMNLEACAACYVLQKLLVPLMGHHTRLVPDIIAHVEDLPVSHNTAAVMLVLCTNGALENVVCLGMLVEMTKARYASVPVLAENNFRFPPQESVPWLESLQLPGFTAEQIEIASSSLSLLFKEIATTFDPQHAGASVLEAQALDVHRRIHIHHEQVKGHLGVFAVEDPNQVMNAIARPALRSLEDFNSNLRAQIGKGIRGVLGGSQTSIQADDLDSQSAGKATAANSLRSGSNLSTHKEEHKAGESPEDVDARNRLVVLEI